MTFDDLEKSTQLATPLELYLFDTGSKTYAYCNGDNDFTFGVNPYTNAAEIYRAVPVDRDRITSSGTLDRSALVVRIADTTDIAALLRGYPVSSVVTLVIRQGHAEASPDFLVAWAGRVLSAKGGNDGVRQVTCQPASTSLKRTGLRRNWQYGCPHALYGPACRADQAYATVSTAAVGANRSTAFIADGVLTARAPLDRWQGGLVQWTDADGAVQIRTILRVTDQPGGTTSLSLGGPASYPAGATLAISLGCDRTMNDCRTLHRPRDEADYGGGNIRNYGGQPFIPTNNPIGLSRNY